MCRALLGAREWLSAHGTAALLKRVGQTVGEIPRADCLDKRFIQASYRGDLSKPPDDLLTGKGLFYITEQRKLFLDCTAGHYQMTWGYNHPELNRIAAEAMRAGIVWDDHSNIPGHAVKRLSERLVAAANGRSEAGPELARDADALNTVLLGVCTGSVAASTAIKIILKRHETLKKGL